MSNRSSKFTVSPIDRVFPYWPSYVILVSFVPVSSRDAAMVAGYGTLMTCVMRSSPRLAAIERAFPGRERSETREFRWDDRWPPCV